MTTEQIQALLTAIGSTGGMGGLAVFVIYILNKVWQERVDEAKKFAEMYRQDNIALRMVLTENTEAITKLLERLAK